MKEDGQSVENPSVPCVRDMENSFAFNLKIVINILDVYFGLITYLQKFNFNQFQRDFNSINKVVRRLSILEII